MSESGDLHRLGHPSSSLSTDLMHRKKKKGRKKDKDKEKEKKITDWLVTVFSRAFLEIDGCVLSNQTCAACGKGQWLK